MLDHLLSELGTIGYTATVLCAGLFLGWLACTAARCIEIDREEAARTIRELPKNMERKV